MSFDALREYFRIRTTVVGTTGDERQGMVAHMKKVNEIAVGSRSGRFLLLLAICIIPLTGCIQLAANLMHVVSGPQVPAEFKGLDGKKIAVVANDESGICQTETTIRLAGNLKGILAGKLRKSSFISQEEVDRWLHDESSREQDFAAIGKGVKADYLIAVEMLDLKLKDGQTLYRGRSNIMVTVWDVGATKIAFRKILPEHSYPVMAGQAATETDDEKFRRAYLLNVASKIGRYFYAHEFGEDVATDATILSF